MLNNCLLCGVGGQGTVLAAKLIALAAMNKGQAVRTSETIGMAQRGGSVASHVRIGDEIFSPLIPFGAADVIIAFEPAEAVRCLPYLKEGGVIIANNKPVIPTTSYFTGTSYNTEEIFAFLNEKNAVLIDCDKICRECGSTKVVNIALLAAAIRSGALSLTRDDLENAVKQRLKPQFHEMNLKAIALIYRGNDL